MTDKTDIGLDEICEWIQTADDWQLTRVMLLGADKLHRGASADLTALEEQQNGS